MDGTSDLFSIVVVGAMNPRIHHPVWYEQIGLLSKEEVQLSLALPDMMCSAAVSQFQVGSLNVLCLPDRWQVATPDAGQLGRALELAAKVFQVLDHTPVSLFGFNFHFTRPSPMQKPAAYLASLVRSLGIGLEGDEIVSSTIIFRKTTEDTRSVRVATTTIGPVDDTQPLVQVINGFEYRIKTQGHFDLGPWLRELFPAVERESRSQLDRTISSLKRGSVR